MPVYVHAKVCVVDDVWAVVGSDNFNRRSWTHDSELSAAVLDGTRDPREPYDRAGSATAPGCTRGTAAAAHAPSTSTWTRLTVPAPTWRPALAELRRSADALEAWHRGYLHRPASAGAGCAAPVDPDLSRTTGRWATALYRWVYDPDGRPAALRRRHRLWYPGPRRAALGPAFPA